MSVHLTIIFLMSHHSLALHYHRKKSSINSLYYNLQDSLGFDFLYLSSLIPSSSHTTWIPLVMNYSLSPNMLYFRNYVPFIYYLLPSDDLRNSHLFFKILFTLISSIKVFLIPPSLPQNFSLHNNTSITLYWKCLHRCKSVCTCGQRSCHLYL